MKTNTKSLTILITNILALTIPTLGQEEHQIDQDLKTCLSIDSNQTTRGMNRCTYRGEDSWDKELNKYYTSLINKLDSIGLYRPETTFRGTKTMD